jgi:hypothetical protein
MRLWTIFYDMNVLPFRDLSLLRISGFLLQFSLSRPRRPPSFFTLPFCFVFVSCQWNSQNKRIFSFLEHYSSCIGHRRQVTWMTRESSLEEKMGTPCLFQREREREKTQFWKNGSKWPSG